MKTTLLIPTLNEIEGLRLIMPRIQRDWYDQLIILDGGSTDGTIEFAKEMRYFVYIQKEPGIRQAYNEVLSLIQGDVLITFSPDGNCIPELIPALVTKMAEGFDMVIASRYLNQAKSEDDDLVTGFGNWLFTATVNLLHGGRYTDVMGIYRAYRTQIIYDLELNKDEGFSPFEKWFGTRGGWEPLLSVRALKRKLKIAEIPGDEPARVGGQRKLQVIRWGALYFSQFIRELFYWH
jgi:glycosyltransferase involved in cell wall biosynthesis